MTEMNTGLYSCRTYTTTLFFSVLAGADPQQTKEEYLVPQRSKTQPFFKVALKKPFLLPHSILKQLGGRQKLTYLRKKVLMVVLRDNNQLITTGRGNSKSPWVFINTQRKPSQPLSALLLVESLNDDSKSRLPRPSKTNTKVF